MKHKTVLITGALLLSSFGMAQAVTLQIDFGDEGQYNGTDAPAGITDTTWNVAGVNDITSGLFYGDGSAATGVSLDLGNSNQSGTGAVDWTNVPNGQSSSNAAGTSGIYLTDLMRDWTFDNSRNNLGIRISGLAAGSYDVYSIVRERNQLDRTYVVGIGAGDIDLISSLAPTIIGDATGSSTWIDGQNYALERVTVTGVSDFITVIIDPTNGSGEQRFASISGLQIVSVPEPSSVVLFGLGLLSFAARRGR